MVGDRGLQQATIPQLADQREIARVVTVLGARPGITTSRTRTALAAVVAGSRPWAAANSAIPSAAGIPAERGAELHEWGSTRGGAPDG